MIRQAITIADLMRPLYADRKSVDQTKVCPKCYGQRWCRTCQGTNWRLHGQEFPESATRNGQGNFKYSAETIEGVKMAYLAGISYKEIEAAYGIKKSHIATVTKVLR